MGILVVCGETKLLGKGQADWQIVRMMEYKKRINIQQNVHLGVVCEKKLE